MQSRVVSIAVAFGLALLALPAQAATLSMQVGGTNALVAGNVYTTAVPVCNPAGSFGPGAAHFDDAYFFTYSPPPTLGALSTTTNNILSTTFGIDNFSFVWRYVDVPQILASGSAPFTNLALALNLAGTYELILSGDPRSGGGQYTASLTVNPVPIPPAVLLFGSALTGIGLLTRRRRLKAAA
jgi:hypothetical protein